MRLDSSLLEELMARARLSLREREAMRLDCSADYTDQLLAEIMGCGIASVRTYRHRGRKKLLAAQAGYVAEQLRREQELLGREQEQQDFAEVNTMGGFLGAVIDSMRTPVSNPHTPPVGITWTEYDWDFHIETTMALDGAVHAGNLVTPGDVLGHGIHRAVTAEENRARLKNNRLAS